MFVKPVSLGLCVSVTPAKNGGCVPSYDVGYFVNYSTGKCAKETRVSNCSAKLTQGLNCTLPYDPQELNLLGSMRIGNTTKRKLDSQTAHQPDTTKSGVFGWIAHLTLW